MADTIKVRAVAERRMPLESDPRKYVVGTMDVPNTPHYRRAIMRGDIERVTDEAAPAKKQKAEG
jgi:hypothetical protein